MQEIVQLIREFFIPYGAWGLLILSFLDSTFVPMPQVIDTLVITLSFSKPEFMVFYALGAVGGSSLGGSVLYLLGRRGGQVLLHRKISRGYLEKIQQALNKYDVLAILIAGVIPPPFPYKVFIFSVGTFQFVYHRFILAVLLSRSLRFYFEGIMAILYGDYFITFVKERYQFVFLIFLGFILVSSLVYRTLANVLVKEERTDF